ncbi:protein DMP10 [Nicotiana tomentosiformis]|uniref:protein DMP10 n=1 Tax=Nicotiana tomentosiformis TaxID=4098 RepID=UPI00051C3923|nr:protein DMP10 [Nicotiana tomentosiformis]
MAEPSLSQRLPPPPVPMSSPSPPQQPPPAARSKVVGETAHPIHKTLDTAANIANLLPNGTVLAFRMLIPSFSNKGVCQISNKLLTAAVIGFCSAACFFSSFTDSCVLSSDGKSFYGIATTRGIHLFNFDNDPEKILEGINMRKYKLKCLDFVHAFVSLLVFLVFAFCDSDVQTCFFSNQQRPGSNVNALVMNLPLAAGFFASFFFLIFPTTRRGIGYAGLPA